jgi:REP element-mobilizing transposase RayT
MSHSLTQLYVHLVWTTHLRLPLIVPEVEQQLYPVILNKCRDLECHALALGGIEDHVHLFVQFPAKLAIAKLAKEVKGASSHFVNHEVTRLAPFQWQAGYGAFTVSKRSVDSVIEYVRNQKQRHKEGHLLEELEYTNDDGD